MTKISYWENKNTMMFKQDEGYDFINPAEQNVVRNLGGQLWKPTFASRSDFPMWDRKDIFRTINYKDTVETKFTIPKISYSSGIVQPSGLVSLQPVSRTSPVTIPDKELYHHDVQHVFSLFTQFDTLVIEQVAAFTDLSVERVLECLKTLWSYGVLERSDDSWGLYDVHGYIWRLNRRSVALSSYVDGMDSIPRALTVGNWDIKDEPPGSSARSSIKHNLYSAEILLRLCESADNIIGVWGDPFLSESVFHEQDPDALRRRSHADGAAITRDGSIVLFEVVGAMNKSKSVNRNIVDKAASWVGVIANSPLDISVIFIDTTFYNTYNVTLNSVDIGLRKESHKFAPEEYSRERAIKHIGVTGGAFWFPEDGSISQAGTRLTAYNPVHRKYNHFDLPDKIYANREIRKNIIVNTVSSLHSPKWAIDDIKGRKYVYS